jgi:ureidoglycolate lyase
MPSYYSVSQSKKPGRISMSLFRCSPRKLRKLDPNSANHHMPNMEAGPGEGTSQNNLTQLVYDINILERHPYTSQIFIPMGLSGVDSSTKYLVIVAPTLPVSRSRKDLANRPKPYPTPDPKPKRSLFDVFSRARPSPFTNERSPPTPNVPDMTTSSSASLKPKGPGLPDLNKIRVFIANGDQAVSYGPGTWHAPMVVIGAKPVNFLVVQHLNGVASEDCQEIELKSDGPEGLTVMVEVNPAIADRYRAKL